MTISCTNCKYFSEVSVSAMGMGYYYNSCTNPRTPRINNINIRQEAHHINKNHDCKEYERKWWKFWVKDDG